MKVSICPKCGSTNIKLPPKGLDIHMTFKDYCQDCNNIGNFPEIDIEQVKNFKKQIKSKNI